ncbi:ECF RNA polymerase sigma factor EcfG [Phycisphaerales bacterium]|nr:ECF RNA polymerase sigma factor EcfG [Phycisphaerales bacterium]
MHNIAPAQGEGAGGVGTRLTPEQFAARLQECHRTVWTIAVSIVGDPSLADDMVQEAAAVALSKLDEFDPSTSFHAWFGQVVRFVALNEGRKRRRTRSEGDSRIEGAADRSDPAAPAAFDSRVRAALESLAEAPRTCLLMRTLHGMSFTQIAAALDIPEGTAMSHVHRARATLRERLASMNPAPRDQGGGA